MLAYQNPEWPKAKVMAQMRAHAEADELIQGTGWEDGKGCMIGCLFNEYNHSHGPGRIGVPENLLHLCDAIFEGLTNGEAKTFALDLPNAIKEGDDLSKITDRWVLWLLSESGVRDRAISDGKIAIDQVISLLQRKIAGDMPTDDEWNSAAQSARSAQSAWAAAESARSARSAWAAAESAWAAAESAAWQSYAAKLIELIKEVPA